MTTSKSIFACTKCDAQFAKWTGRCLECGGWGSVAEGLAKPSAKAAASVPAGSVIYFDKIIDAEGSRLPVGIKEIDRVLGGGLVEGTLLLLAGEPGIGKSSLVLQIAAGITSLRATKGSVAIPTGLLRRSAPRNDQQTVLYVSGEESPEQIKMRLNRLKIPASTCYFLGETNVETIIATLEKERPQLAIIDSIQTVTTSSVDGDVGNLNQIKASTVKFLETAKRNKIVIILVGQVTKDGALAGPRTLEHLVDAVLYLEGDRRHHFRLLRAVKNRFGSTDEVGVFEMTGVGLKEVANPSAAFLAEREEKIPGSVVTCLMEGQRPLLVEIQALVSKTNFGYPQRRASGFDSTRLQVLLAVLNRRAHLNLDSQDVHLNVVGGLEADEPASDLAVALAIASAFKEKVLPAGLLAFGEIGLGGEVRSVPQLERRLQEAKHLGFQYAVVPRAKQLPAVTGLKLAPIKNLIEIVDLVLK